MLIRLRDEYHQDIFECNIAKLADDSPEISISARDSIEIRVSRENIIERLVKLIITKRNEEKQCHSISFERDVSIENFAGIIFDLHLFFKTKGKEITSRVSCEWQMGMFIYLEKYFPEIEIIDFGDLPGGIPMKLKNGDYTFVFDLPFFPSERYVSFLLETPDFKSNLLTLRFIAEGEVCDFDFGVLSNFLSKKERLSTLRKLEEESDSHLQNLLLIDEERKEIVDSLRKMISSISDERLRNIVDFIQTQSVA